MKNKRTGRLTIEVQDQTGELADLWEQARQQMRVQAAEAAVSIAAKAPTCVDVSVRQAKNIDILRHLMTFYLDRTASAKSR